MHELADLNWLAVLVAAVAAFVLGALWYGVLFSKAWVAAHGFSSETVERMRKESPASAFAISFVAYLVMAIVLALFLHFLGVESAGGGAHIGALAWLGFVATVGITDYVYADRHYGQKLGTYWIDVAYQLAILLVMGAILGAWH